MRNMKIKNILSNFPKPERWTKGELYVQEGDQLYSTDNVSHSYQFIVSVGANLGTN